MELLAKYAGEARFLDNGLFRFTQPGSLNDPDEARPVILCGQYAPEDVAVAAEAASQAGMHPLDDDLLEALYLAPFPAHRYNEEAFPLLWPFTEPRLRAEPFKTIAEFDLAVAERAVELCITRADATALVFSLTFATASEPMWAYYGGNHSGVEVRFRRDHPFFSDRLYEVEYSDEPVRVSSNAGWVRICGQTIPTDHILDRRLQLVPLDLLLRKRSSWGHEREVRLLRQPEEASEIAGWDARGSPVYLFEVPAEAVHSVVLGYSADAGVERQVLKSVAGSVRWSHLEVSRRVRSPAGIREERLR